MSADNITQCPACREDQLREWRWISIEPLIPDGRFSLVIEYRALCRACDYQFLYNATVPVPQ